MLLFFYAKQFCHAFLTAIQGLGWKGWNSEELWLDVPIPFLLQTSCGQTNIDVNTLMYLTPQSEFRTEEDTAVGKIRWWETFISIPPSQGP